MNIVTNYDDEDKDKEDLPPPKKSMLNLNNLWETINTDNDKE